MNNKTPLHIAAYSHSKDVGELLILRGADINAKDFYYENKKISFLSKII